MVNSRYLKKKYNGGGIRNTFKKFKSNKSNKSTGNNTSRKSGFKNTIKRISPFGEPSWKKTIRNSINRNAKFNLGMRSYYISNIREAIELIQDRFSINTPWNPEKREFNYGLRYGFQKQFGKIIRILAKKDEDITDDELNTLRDFYSIIGNIVTNVDEKPIPYPLLLSLLQDSLSGNEKNSLLKTLKMMDKVKLNDVFKRLSTQEKLQLLILLPERKVEQFNMLEINEQVSLFQILTSNKNIEEQKTLLNSLPEEKQDAILVSLLAHRNKTRFLLYIHKNLLVPNEKIKYLFSKLSQEDKDIIKDDIEQYDEFKDLGGILS